MRLGIEEQVPKLYGLGTYECSLVGKLNEAVNFLLCGVPTEQHVEMLEQLNEGALVFDLQ